MIVDLDPGRNFHEKSTMLGRPPTVAAAALVARNPRNAANPRIAYGGLATGSCWRDDVNVRIEFTLDCSDLDRMTRFWRDAAGFVVGGIIEGRYVSLGGHGVTLTLQRVDEPKTVKNRMHLDLLVDDLDSEVRRLEELGAIRLTTDRHEEFGQTWFVLADPEGNEFCVANDREDSKGLGG